VVKPLVALAAAAALGGGSAASAALTPIQFPLTAQSDSGEHGTATLLQGTNGLIVRLRLAGAPDGVDQPAHIHKGSCSKLDPKPAYPLKTVVGGISQTTLPNVMLSDLMKGDFAINVHKSTKEVAVYVACGNIPKK